MEHNTDSFKAGYFAGLKKVADLVMGTRRVSSIEDELFEIIQEAEKATSELAASVSQQ